MDVCADLGNANDVCNGTVIMGSEGTLTMPTKSAGDTLVLYPEALAPELNTSGMDGWPKATREKYLESIGYGARKTDRPKPQPTQTIPVERGPEHNEHFICCLRDGSPSKEDAEFGHCAAGAAHLGNIAFRSGRRVHWDFKTNRVTKA